MTPAATETSVSGSVEAGLRTLGTGSTSGRAEKTSNKLVFRAAEKSIEFMDHLRAHYRETRRTAVEIPCDLQVLLPNGSLFDSGSALVRDVSPSGALIAGIKLSKECFPASGFKLKLTLKGDDYKGIGIEATPVRLVTEVGGLGVRFDEIFVTV
jgi:hypothetical protein